MNSDILINGLPIIPIIIGLTECLKIMGINKKFIPIMALIVGLFFGFGYNGFHTDPTKIMESIATGLYLGLSAIGLYSGYTNTVDGLKEEKNKTDKTML